MNKLLIIGGSDAGISAALRAKELDAEPLFYAPLPTSMVSRDEAQIRLLTCGSNQQRC